ncbi:MAG TPA: YfiR/HmsC family protein [Anaeromyxobacteraceae bacterium]|nr:YfiR/HmsC family protein [Anaeromyxobacteraceae bacterium]
MALALPTASLAEEVSVPVNLQTEMLSMLAGHDRNLPARAGSEVHTLVLTKANDDSARAAAQFKAAAKPVVAGLAQVVEVAAYGGAPALAEACKAKHLAIVYLTPGFTAAEATAIGQALEGGNVLTVAANPALVKKGIVLGFDLVSGRAKILVDLTQAAKQRVSFDPEVLGLMAVSQ